MNLNAQRGMTLIELMVSIVILAILAAVAIPTFNDFFQKSRVRGAADAIVSLLATARLEAVKSDRNVAVAFGGTTAAWCVGGNSADEPDLGNPVLDAEACDCTTDGDCLVSSTESRVRSTDYTGVTIDVVSPAFTFDSKLGTLSDFDDAETVNLTSPNGRFTVRVAVSALGHATVCVPSDKPVIAGYPTC